MGRLREVQVAGLHKAEWNYRKADGWMLERLVANMRRTGQVENLIVRKLGDGLEVVNGNHRLDALVEMGERTAVVWDLGEVSQALAMRIAVETNETRFDRDHVQLSEVITEIAQAFSAEDLDATMPISPDDRAEYSELMTFSWDQFDGSDKAPGGRTSVGVERDVFADLVREGEKLDLTPGRALDLIAGGESE